MFRYFDRELPSGLMSYETASLQPNPFLTTMRQTLKSLAWPVVLNTQAVCALVS